jgi:hypothetical protein
MKRIIAVIVSLVIVLGGAFGWFYMYGPCGVTPVKEATDQIHDRMTEFQDAMDVAASTARMSLSGPVAELQSIRRATDDIEVPACLSEAKDFTVRGMQNYIQSFTAFMAEEPDATVGNYMDAGLVDISQASQEFTAVSQCVPFCNP